MNETIPRYLRISLLSDTTFGGGSSPGEVDTEVEHDRYGIPSIGGKAVRGLLRDSWLSMRPRFPALHDAGDAVFGPTKRFDDVCMLRFGDAVLAAGVREWLLAAVTREHDPLPPGEILAGCTTIRYQTAENRRTGASLETTLRASRVVLRGFEFDAPLQWRDGCVPNDRACAVLAAAALATRHGGLLRNRGRGHLRMTLNGCMDFTRSLLTPFAGA